MTGELPTDPAAPDAAPSDAANSASPIAATGWSLLLDRLEERLRLLEKVTMIPVGAPVPDPGPGPTDADLPPTPPTPRERMRLLALQQGHDQVEIRMHNRRRILRQAQHYHLGTS